MKKNPAPGGLAYWMTRLQSLVITPNFYCSLAYLKACGAGCYLSDDRRWAYVVDTTDDGDEVCMFPPVPATDEVARAVPPQDWPPLFDFIWADFNGGKNVPANYNHELMDYQYIYDQALMAEAAGSEFATFRKNARKWPLRTGLELQILPASKVADEQLQELCGDWLEAHQAIVQDADNMLTYLLERPSGALVRGLVDNYGYLRALIGYDMNYCYVNFRYCITRPNEPYLEEYVRMLFYRSPIAQLNVGRRLINDGGVVDNPGLQQFKDRLNPIHRFESHTWWSMQGYKL